MVIIALFIFATMLYLFLVQVSFLSLSINMSLLLKYVVNNKIIIYTFAQLKCTSGNVGFHDLPHLSSLWSIMGIHT